MTFAWREQPAALLEPHFNPRVAVPDFQEALERYAAHSAAARQRLPGVYDLRYGVRPQQTFDLHRAAPAPSAPPLVLFLHGGYWRALDKRDHSFVASLFVEAGVTLANVNYDLCPSVTLDEIVDEIREAVLYFVHHATDVGADAQRLFLVGHSAGAHLVARMLAQDWTAAGLPAETISGAVVLSGIYEPEVVLHLTVNAEIRLTPAMAARHDCLRLPPQRQVPLLIAVGGAEPTGWIGQSRAYRDVCVQAELAVDWMCIEGANHFTLLEQAVTVGSPLAAAICHLVTGRERRARRGESYPTWVARHPICARYGASAHQDVGHRLVHCSKKVRGCPKKSPQMSHVSPSLDAKRRARGARLPWPAHRRRRVRRDALRRGPGPWLRHRAGARRRVRDRLFPWTPAGDPWTTLLWCNGRVELPDHGRLKDWLWHPAPLRTWDGTRRRREG